MTSLEKVLFLSVLQGVAEFLPVSSSGHLALARRFLGDGIGAEHLLLTIILHLGTMLAIAWGLRMHIRSLTRQQIFTLFFALLPLVPILPALGTIKMIMQSRWGLGIGFIIGGLWMLIAEYLTDKLQIQRPPSYRSALFVGTAQALAILPGISRLGSTTTTGKLLGWKKNDAVIFSLLLAIPTVFGGTLLEARELSQQTATLLTLPFHYYIIGFFISFFVGLLALRLLFWVVKTTSFRPFGYYCIFIGCIAIATA